MTPTHTPDPTLDLFLERVVEVSPHLVWAAWTTPEYLKRWFTPAPWQTVDCEIDLRPGGIFRTVMRSPDGQDFANAGCYLEIIENEKLVWTAALKPGYRPQSPAGALLFTAMILLEAAWRRHEIHRYRDARRRGKRQKARKNGFP